MFCPKCGAILVPKKENNKRVLHCSCGFTNRDIKEVKITEQVNPEKEIVVVEREDYESLPKTKTECPKCGNKEAYFWTVQTRASDEPETKFLRCSKCKHTWRDYD